jgi:SAM-dependent methyltransferase
LAARTGTVERYAREWLEQQAVAGFLTVDDLDAAAEDRRYHLPAAYLPVLVDEDDLNYLSPLATLAVSVTKPIDAVLSAYRDGGGVPYEDYGADTWEGVSALNRPQFVNLLAGWLAAVPEIDDRLRGTPPARIADLACGSAWSSIAMARAYPDALIDAVDADRASIDGALKNIAAAGLGDRVRARVHDAAAPLADGGYDLVTIFEALHDMNHPVEALRASRTMLAEGGCVLIADEKVADRFSAPGDDLERFNYGWSILHCLAVGMIDADSTGTGAVIRADTVRRYAGEAGFSRIDVLPIEHDFWRFYRLMP